MMKSAFQTSLPFVEKPQKKAHTLFLNEEKFLHYLEKSVEIDLGEAKKLFREIQEDVESFRGNNPLEYLEQLISIKINKYQVKKPQAVSKIKLTDNAQIVLKKRYLQKNEKGEPIETPEQLFRRVAITVAQADKIYNPKTNLLETEETFYQMLANLEFLPNSPTLMNAGKRDGQLSACFVLPIDDSIESIFETLKYTAMIQKSGGGTGFNFSKIRPKNSQVQTTQGTASGPLSFISLFDAVTDTIKQGGTRRGANMAILNADHPDILEFIHSKESGKLANFNISVGITDAFIKAVENHKEVDLIDPQTKKVRGQVNAKNIFDQIIEAAWKTGDPGLVFLNRINDGNPIPEAGLMESTNPCGEQPLLPYESCNLGSINLNSVLKDSEVQWPKLEKLVKNAVHFLDNIIDVNTYPLQKIELITKANRKIGLGVMGLADLFVTMNIPYDSENALQVAEKIISFIREKAIEASEKLARERGAFPNFGNSLLATSGRKPIRHATLITIAPTGTLSLIAGCSSGIEPIFAQDFVKEVLEGEKLPESYPQTVATAHEIAPEWHVRMQALFQKYSDNAVSKTVNLPYTASLKDVENTYWLAYRLGCKGITIYRDQSKPSQVLSKK